MEKTDNNLRRALPATQKTGNSEVRIQDSEWKPEIQETMEQDQKRKAVY